MSKRDYATNYEKQNKILPASISESAEKGLVGINLLESVGVIFP